MDTFAVQNNTLINTGEIDRLDENLLNRLSSRNRKQALSENSKKTYAAVIRDYNRFILDNGLAVNEDSLLAYFDSISHQSPSTLNKKKYALLKVIKAQLGRDSVLHKIAIEKAFEAIPTYQIDMAVSSDKCLTEAQVKDMMNAAAPKTRLIIQFLFKTACRVSEMTAIRLSDCIVRRSPDPSLNGASDAKGDSVEIRVIGKGRKIRKVIIPFLLFDSIRGVYRGDTWLFESKSGKPLNRNNVGIQIKKVGRRIGLSNVHPHMLRHTRATDMIINKGISTKATSLYLGHSSTAITLDMYVKDRVNIESLFAKDSV